MKIRKMLRIKNIIHNSVHLSEIVSLVYRSQKLNLKFIMHE